MGIAYFHGFRELVYLVGLRGESLGKPLPCLRESFISQPSFFLQKIGYEMVLFSQVEYSQARGMIFNQCGATRLVLALHFTCKEASAALREVSIVCFT